MRDALIDLGEVPADGAGGPETALPRAPVPYRRILGFLAVVLLALLGGAGPPPPPRPAPVVLPLALGDSVRVDGDRLFVLGLSEPIGTVMRNHTIRAYDLPGMNLLGTYKVAVSGDVFAIVDGGDGVLLVSYSDYASGTSEIVAVRPGGGPPVWKRPTGMLGHSERGALVLASDMTGPISTGGRQVWRALDPRTGAERWSVEQPENGQTTIGTGFYRSGFPDLLYTLHGDGRLEARDGRTGQVTATGRVTQPVGLSTRFWAGGGVVLVERGTEETIAYDDRTLAERWRRDGPVLPDDGYPQDCGPVVCVVAVREGLIGIDPATGREIWRAGGFDSSEMIGDRILASHASRAEPVLAVLDPGTGRTTAVPGAWVSGGPGPDPGTAYVHRIRLSDNTVRYGVLDLATGRVRLLGVADRIAGDCQFAPGVLLCRRVDTSIVVQRL